tara:strand:+ start:1552 stop:2544 length:993 start_codon:yes stop_codon:yes gene_type:complete
MSDIPPSTSADEAAEVEQPVPVSEDAPDRTPLPDDPRMLKLLGNVKDALRALPIYFRSATNIEGLEAGDLFSLNSVLGGTIEVQTVATLNRVRDVWDPDDEWVEYSFERSSQSFPDVRLVSRNPSLPSPVLGIELKGWYVLSKELEPSARFTATRDACSPWDLVVFVPWRLSNVLSGVPVVYEPFIEQAIYAADMRNHYWRVTRGAKGGDTGITPPKDVHPYPPAKTKTSDKANNDSGGNFGRLGRVPELMSDYVTGVLMSPVAGIGARHWVSFFKTYLDNADETTVNETIERALARVSKPNEKARQEAMVRVLRELRPLLNGEPPEPTE